MPRQIIPLSPTLLAEFHPAKNGELQAIEMAAGSEKVIWWLSDCGHEWESSPYARRMGKNCPICSGNRIIVGINDLASTNVDLAKVWNYDRNGKILPTQVTALSAKIVWWKGPCGHEWSKGVKDMVRNTECIFCSGFRLLSGFNDLESKSSRLAAEWHPTKNEGLSPSEVLATSGKRVWWKCENKHEWQATVANRYKRSSGCAFCLGIYATAGANDAATTHPQLIARWHPTKNGDEQLSSYSANSDAKRFWWKDEFDHEWQGTIYGQARIKKDTPCPYCAGRKLLVHFNDLKTRFPIAGTQWHPTKNGDLSPKDVLPSSHLVVWWKCEKEHEWEAGIRNRIKAGKLSGCPVCSNNLLYEGSNDLLTVHPSMKRFWSDRNKLGPHQTLPKSAKRFLWKGDCGHEWESAVYTQVAHHLKGKDCPYCNDRIFLTGLNDLQTKEPELATEFDAEANGCAATEVLFCSATDFQWKCEHGHKWTARPSSRARLKTDCPVCCNQLIIAGINDLATTRPDVAAFWHPTKNGSLLPAMVSEGNDKKVWWLGECGHEWDAVINAQRKYNRCPFCTNRRLLVGFNDLATLYPRFAKQFHPTKNGSLTADQILAHTWQRVWWLCENNHEWETTPNGRIRRGLCQQCHPNISLAELELLEILASLGLSVETSDKKALKGKEIDLYLPALKVGIEFNGLYWHREMKKRSNSRHYDKYAAAKAAGVTLLQVWEDDWRFRKSQVVSWLAERLDVVDQLANVDQSLLGGGAPLDVHRVDLEVLKIVELDVKSVNDFMTANSVQGESKNGSGDSLFGSLTDPALSYGVEDAQGLLCAVLSVLQGDADTLCAERFQTLNGAYMASPVGTASIGQQPVAQLSGRLVELLLAHVRTQQQAKKITVSLDNCMGDEALFTAAGFTEVSKVDPDYMYVIKGERLPRNEYPVERFRTDPALKFEDGLDEMGLADLNGLNRIWDAGKMHLICQL